MAETSLGNEVFIEADQKYRDQNFASMGAQFSDEDDQRDENIDIDDHTQNGNEGE
jgi:hypothetical protein